MSIYGEVLFSKSPLVRWAVSPFLLLTLVVLPICGMLVTPLTSWSTSSFITIVALETLGWVILVGLWTPQRISFMLFRVATCIVFAICSWYFFSETFLSGKVFHIDTHRNDATPWNSTMALIFIGMPCLLFTVLGRFTLRKPIEEDPDDFDDEETEQDAAANP